MSKSWIVTTAKRSYTVEANSAGEAITKIPKTDKTAIKGVRLRADDLRAKVKQTWKGLWNRD